MYDVSVASREVLLPPNEPHEEREILVILWGVWVMKELQKHVTGDRCCVTAKSSSKRTFIHSFTCLWSMNTHTVPSIWGWSLKAHREM